MLNDNNYKELFNWNGHNMFWEGRSIDHQRKYNDGLNGNKLQLPISSNKVYLEKFMSFPKK